VAEGASVDVETTHWALTKIAKISQRSPSSDQRLSFFALGAMHRSFSTSVRIAAKKKPSGRTATTRYQYQYQGHTHTITYEPAEPAPPPSMPTTNWDDPVFHAPSRKPIRTMYSVPLGSNAPISELRPPVMTQKQARRSLMRFPTHPTRVGIPPVPGLQVVPPIAIPRGTNIASETQARNAVLLLRDAQIRAGHYEPYQAGATLATPVAANKPESSAVLTADQALSLNNTMHPTGRRYVMERIGAQLHTKV